MSATIAPLATGGAWHGGDLARSEAWVRRFEARHLAEIERALAQCRDLPPFAVTRDDFPLPETAPLLRAVALELEDGLGLVRLTGLDRIGAVEEDLRRIFWGLCSHLGTALYQNARGEIMGEVRDETRDAAPSYASHEPGRVKPSRARARSAGPLRFHTDRCDVIALCCARTSKAGGVSKLASAVTIFNEIQRRRPDLIEVMMRDFWRAQPEDERNGPGGPLVALPIFGIRDGKLTTQYSRTFVEQAQEFPEVPRLTPVQIEAMDLLAEIAEEVCLHAAFAPGDLQFLNNHVIYHGRTAYEDDEAAHEDRLLLRLWLSVPNSRALPDGFERFWGSTGAGALRGGTEQANRQRAPRVAA